MTEAAAAYQETNRERSTLKNSSYHKKNGSAVTKLGNKPMSWQEINKKHGPVQKYDLDSFMTFEEFKLLPPDLKVKYVNGLCKKWKIRVCHVSEHLFKQGEKGLMGYLKIFDLYKQCTSSGEWTEENAEKFRKAVEDWENRVELAEVVDISEVQRKNDIINNAEFITYEEFKIFNDDEKVAYLNNLFDKWQISYAAAEHYLFHTGRTTLNNYMNSRGLLGKIESKFHGPKKQKILNEEFDKAVKAWRGESDSKETAAAENPETEAWVRKVAEEADAIAGTINEYGKAVEEAKAEAKTDIPVETQVTEDLNDLDDPCDPKDFWHGNDFFPTMATSRYQFNPGIGLNEEQELEQESEEDPMKYHDSSFTASYISKGLDTDEFYALAMLFRNKRVKVEITVTEV